MSRPKDIGRWTRKQFESLPARKWDQDIGPFDALVVLPTRHMHDSGYRCMDFVAVQNDRPTVRLSGCSDVVHIGGIGGFNCQHWVQKFKGVPITTEPCDWSIDSLRTSGLLRLFARKRLTVGPALSSFEVYAETPREPAKEA